MDVSYSPGCHPFVKKHWEAFSEDSGDWKHGFKQRLRQGEYVERVVCQDKAVGAEDDNSYQMYLKENMALPHSFHDNCLC